MSTCCSFRSIALFVVQVEQDAMSKIRRHIEAGMDPPLEALSNWGNIHLQPPYARNEKSVGQQQSQSKDEGEAKVTATDDNDLPDDDLPENYLSDIFGDVEGFEGSSRKHLNPVVEKVLRTTFRDDGQSLLMHAAAMGKKKWFEFLVDFTRQRVRVLNQYRYERQPLNA